MAKRLTDSRKWLDEWFLSLPNNYKLLWLYILDTCNHAGIYKLNVKLAEFCIGSEINIEETLSALKGRAIDLGNNKWFIPKYLKFKYGYLTEKNNMYKAVLNLLNEEHIDKELVSPFIAPYKGYARVKGKGKGKGYYKDKDKKNKDNKDFLTKIKENPAYSHINIDNELAKMDAWLSQPKNRNRKKTTRFVLNWLNRIEVPLITKPVMRLPSCL